MGNVLIRVTSLTMIFILGLSALATKVAEASPPGFCGQFDISKISNEDLLTLLYVPDLEKGLTRNKQCGLFSGEVLPLCTSCAHAVAEESMRVLRPILGEHRHVRWHTMWHETRNLRTLNRNFQKGQSRGYYPADETEESFRDHLEGGSKSGEDFFYMHRQMLKMVQSELAFVGHPCIAPWINLPAKINDPIWPVPRTLVGDERDREASNLATYQMQLENARDPVKLKAITLNELGRMVESDLHVNLHNMYRSDDCTSEAKAQGFCDHLNPVDTAPLNKHFWKIHGLIDTLVGDWLKANGYTEIAVRCEGRAGCYQWKGTWTGWTPQLTPY